MGQGVINPIVKPGTTDPRDPLSYRGITLAPSMYKIYCYVLNSRLSAWSELNNKVEDEQNGFRKGRSTIEQISSLSNIIETRQKSKLPTFCAFIDFKKAYDSINRNILWSKLTAAGINGKLMSSLKSLYSNVSSCVRVNNVYSEWFNVPAGLRQGCSLSPTLFNFYINDFVTTIKALDKGLVIDGQGKVSILLYADDIVLLAENESDLQLMLDTLNSWCNDNQMTVNSKKSQIIHFRQHSVSRSTCNFTCGEHDLEIVDRYVYLGLSINEFLDFNFTAKIVSQSAGRALGLLIAKFKALGGMPYNVFTKLYDSLVWPVISYGAAIWGDRSFSCIDAIQNRAMRFFLGVGKYTPTAAVSGDMGWIPCHIRQWKSTSILWSRFSVMSDERINKRVLKYALNKGSARLKNWPYRITCHLNNINCSEYTNMMSRVSKIKMIREVETNMMNNYKLQWSHLVTREQSSRGTGGNKLRKYKLFKTSWETEQYVRLIMPQSHRSAFAKFRSGVAPLRIETGRYEGLRVNERICPFCRDCTEDEFHVVFQCPLYDEIRESLYDMHVHMKNRLIPMIKLRSFYFCSAAPT